MAKLPDFGFTIELPKRACYVGDKRALFHKWIEVEQVKYIIDSMVRAEAIPRILSTYKDENAYTSLVKPFIVTNVYALVEYENGVVDKVLPEIVQFADGGDFGDMVWFDKEVLEYVRKHKDC